MPRPSFEKRPLRKPPPKDNDAKRNNERCSKQNNDPLASIRLVVLDVDGVLTDGRLYYGPDGEALKAFHVRDGLGITNLKSQGIEIAIISGRSSAPLLTRLNELKIKSVVLGCKDKHAALAQLQAKLNIEPNQTLVMGDDLIDVPMQELSGLFVAPADAAIKVIAIADWVTARRGGEGAVREVTDAIIASQSTPAGFRIVIPARWDSTRLIGKPLRDLAGRPMIAHVIDRARASGALDICVATDDQRIATAVTALGCDVAMTSPNHCSGTDRIAEVANQRGWDHDDIVVNLQGDEPAMPSEMIATVAANLQCHRWAAIATLATPIVNATALFDPNIVKVTRADNGRALLFSRAPIPWVRNAFAQISRRAIAPKEDSKTLPPDIPFLRHLGLYAYRVGVITELAQTPPSAIEQAESLEQLRALSRDLDIHVSIEENAPPDGVDTEADLARMDAYLRSS